MPSSISTVRLVGVPSSSIGSEPRRDAMVPSSTTVTPLAATCWPIRPANAEVCLRLKSPSRPWPTASCSMTPGQPAPSTTSISPAGAGTDSRLTSASRIAPSAASRHALASMKRAKPSRPPAAAPPRGLCRDESRQPSAPAIALAAAFLPVALARDHRNIDAHQRADVAIALAVGPQDFHPLPGGRQTDRDLPHPRILVAGIGVDFGEQFYLA